MPLSPDHRLGRSRRRPERPRIVLFTAKRDWHARSLLAAFSRNGLAGSAIPLERAAFDTAVPHGLRLADTVDLPDGVFVRTMSSGSFEAVTRRLAILHALDALGVPVWNTATAIERCVDKSATTFLLQRTGLPVPPTWVVEGIDAARAVVEAKGGSLVLKPLFGSQGRGLMMIRSAEDLPPPEAVADVYYLQRFVGTSGPRHRDCRVLVVDGEAVAAMERAGTGWITNVKQGGTPVRLEPDPELAGLAVRAAQSVGAWFCGVDIIRAPDGTPYVLEVNSMPAWSGLQSVSDIDIAGHIASRFAAQLAASPLMRVA